MLGDPSLYLRDAMAHDERSLMPPHALELIAPDVVVLITSHVGPVVVQDELVEIALGTNVDSLHSHGVLERKLIVPRPVRDGPRSQDTLRGLNGKESRRGI